MYARVGKRINFGLFYNVDVIIVVVVTASAWQKNVMTPAPSAKKKKKVLTRRLDNCLVDKMQHVKMDCKFKKLCKTSIKWTPIRRNSIQNIYIFFIFMQGTWKKWKLKIQCIMWAQPLNLVEVISTCYFHPRLLADSNCHIVSIW